MTLPTHDDETVTLIFLDIDGVLNVGLREKDSQHFRFNEANVSVVRKLLKSKDKADNATMLLSVMKMRTLDGNASTYGDFLSRNDVDVCDIFVHRFLRIIHAAGECLRIVISSSWRRPEYKTNLQNLEKIITGYLGKKFKFDDHTALEDEAGGADRLLFIGNYIAKYCSEEQAIPKLRVLVLDDFFYQPVDDWKCGDAIVDSLQSAESYLAARAPPTLDVKVQIIHTYDSCSLPSGLQLQIGTGLSLKHIQQALIFLGGSPEESVSVPLAASAEENMEIFNKSFTDRPQDSLDKDPVETLIYLDIDGVLNVGIKDPGGSLSFTEANFSMARKLLNCSENADMAQMLLDVMRVHTGDDNSTKYGDFLSRNDLDVCDTFVHRFIKIMEAAGKQLRVVLCSSWRRPKYVERVQTLEQIISVYLGETFKFHDRTAIESEDGAADRLRIIGDHIEARLIKKGNQLDRIKVLVLDDFFYQPIKGYSLSGGTLVDSVQDAESYLASRVPSTTEVALRIVQTYSRHVLPSGVEVNIGTGLTLHHLEDALTFLYTQHQKLSIKGALPDKPARKRCCELM